MAGVAEVGEWRALGLGTIPSEIYRSLEIESNGQRGAVAWNQWRSKNPDIVPHLREANLVNAYLSRTDLSDRNLVDAKVNHANLGESKLAWVLLGGANLIEANHRWTLINGAYPDESNRSEVQFGNTSIVDVDLNDVRGLKTVTHSGASSIGFDTIYKSKGNIPEVFLRGCGLDDTFIAYMRSLTQMPIQFYSFFISRSQQRMRNRCSLATIFMTK